LHCHLQHAHEISPESLLQFGIGDKEEAEEIDLDAETISDTDIRYESSDEFNFLSDTSSDDEEAITVHVGNGEAFLSYVQRMSQEQREDLDWYCVITRNYFTQQCQRDIAESLKGQKLGMLKDKRTYARRVKPLEKILFPVIMYT
jgi:hypothetical protein